MITKIDSLLICLRWPLYNTVSNSQVYHPNIDLEGNVCLNILREDWKPVLSINTIIYGLYHLFTVLYSVFNGQVHLCDFVGNWYPWPININSFSFNYFFFQEPNWEDPLNHDAAAVLRDNPKMFESNVRRALSGGYVGQTFFQRCI